MLAHADSEPKKYWVINFLITSVVIYIQGTKIGYVGAKVTSTYVCMYIV